MKNKITLMAVGLGTLLMINACQTPEDRAREEHAATVENAGDSENTAAEQNKDNTTDMPAADAQATTPADNATTPEKSANTTAKKGRATIGTDATASSEKMEMDKSGVYARAEVMPSYPGGQSSLEKFVEDNLQYPQDAIDNNVEGRVMISFDVDETGKIYRPMIISDKIGYGLEEEALRIVKQMPQWNPGKMKGKNVKTKFTLPIVYQLI